MAARRKTNMAPVPSLPNESVSYDIRKIENGYVVRQSSSDNKGNYKSKETFHAQKPQIIKPTVTPSVKPRPVRRK